MSFEESSGEITGTNLRLETKYLLDIKYQAQLEKYFEHFMVHDLSGTSTASYKVTSLYFDSPNLRCLAQKKNGDYFKQKFRLRFYNDNPKYSFLEIKEKKGPWSNKRRFRLEVEPSQIVRSDNSGNFDTQTFARAIDPCKSFSYFFYKYHLRPTVVITFRRTAFVCPAIHDLRVTFDTQLDAHSCVPFSKIFEYQFNEYPLETIYKSIMEIKRNGAIPSWLKLVINECADHEKSLSKYSIAIDSLDNQPTKFKSPISHWI